MKSFEYRVDDLLPDILQAIDKPDHWEIVLQRIATGAHATKASMHSHRFSSLDPGRHTAGSRLYSYGYDAASATKYREYYAVLDPYVKGIRRLHGRKRTGTNSDLLSEAALKASTFYNDYGRENDIFHVAWSVFQEDEQHGSGVALIRPYDASAFDRVDVEWLRRISPHLQRAFHIQRRLELASSVVKQMTNGFQRLDFEVIVLDGDRKVVHASTCVEKLFADLEGIKMRGSRLEIKNNDLANLLDDAMLALERRQSRVGNLQLSRHSQSGKLNFYVFPNVRALETTFKALSDQAGLLLLIHDPAYPPGSRVRMLRSHFPTLTKREAQVLDGLLSGPHVDQVATRLRLQQSSAQRYLNKIYAKTGIRSLAEWIMLMQKMPGESF